MHAPASLKQPSFGGLKNALVVATFAAGIAVGVAGPVALDHAPALHRGGHGAAVAAPAQAGNADPQPAALSVDPQPRPVEHLRAYASVGMGEGWLGHGRPAATLAPTQRLNSISRFRFLEANLLPGDDVELLAPPVVRGKLS